MMAQRLPRDLCAAALSVLTLAIGVGTARAQTSNGVITGRVIDPSVAGVPGAKVVLTQELTGVGLTTATDGTGDFVFPSVPPGSYAVAVTVPGFSRFEKTGLVLTSSARLFTGALKLALGAEQETVTVVAGTDSSIQLASQERSAVLDDKQMATLSTPGRDYMNMLKLLPGTTYPDGNGASSLGTSSPPIINGVRSDYVALTLDGVVANNRGLGTTENMASLDAIAEVKVLLSNYQAEYGKNGGAIVNATTKSGTRQFHGSAYYYKRDERWNANDFFRNRAGEPRARYRYNTVGYNLGGPVKLAGLGDRLFFFWSHEIQPNTRPSTRNYTFPTDLERKGDFSQSLDTAGKLIVVKDPLTGQPFPGNVIPQIRIDPDTQKLLGVFPLPNFFDTAISGRKYNYRVTDSVDNPVNQEILRLDYTPSARWRFSLRGLLTGVGNDGLATTANSNQWGIKQSYDTRNYNVGANVTYLANPTTVNELSFGVSGWLEKQNIEDSELAKLQKDQLGVTIGQFNPVLNPLGVIPVASFNGIGGSVNGASIGYDGRWPMDNHVYAVSVADSLSKVIGSHTLKVGVYFEQAEYLQRHHGSNFAGNFSFNRNTNNPNDANHPYANALLGNFGSYTETTARVDYQPINRVFEWFAQDNWKVSQRLTLDYGLRFTYDIQPFQKNDVAGNFYPALYSRAQEAVMYVPALDPAGKKKAMDPRTGQFYDPVLVGYFVPGSGNPYSGTIAAGTAGYPRGFANSSGVLFAPRVGFAFDPIGDGKTAIRGGFGIFYNARERSGQMGDMSFNPPMQAQQTQFYGNVGRFLNAGSLTAPSSFNRVIGSDPKMLTFYQMSIGVQRDIGWNTVLDVAYSGNLGRNLGQTRQINGYDYGTRFLPQNIDPTTNKPLADNFLRPYYGYGSLPLLEFEGKSEYHSLQAQIKHRFTRGFQAGVSYTWSRAKNYGDSYDSGIAAFNDPDYWNWGYAGYDRTHTLVANWVWELPKASRLWDTVPIKVLFDNWRFSGIYAWVTGAPNGVSMSLKDGADLSGGGDGATITMNGNPNLPGSQRSFERWFDTSMFSRTPAYDPAHPALLGSGAAASRQAYRGPGIDNFDLTFFKDFPIRKGVTAQLRWEMYNAFNHTQFSGVDDAATFDAAGNQTNPQFGQITSARSARIQQLSVRLSF